MPDSIIFLSAYKYTEEDNEELVYYDFAKRIYAIERECYEKYKLTDTVLAMTSSTNFRYELYPEYKQNRKKKDDKAEKLSQLVKRTKKLIYDRLQPILVCNSIAEADDVCIAYSREKGYLVAAMDSDVVGQSVTPVFNFHNKHWKFIHQGLTDKETFINTLIDSIKGKSKDNVRGVKGIGEVGAKEFVDNLTKGNKSFSDYIDLFDTPAEALKNYRLCDCSQYKNGKLELVSIKDIDNLMTEHICPF